LGDKFTRDEIMWEIPLCQLNQIVHAQLCYNGATCRRSGAIDLIDSRFAALSFDYPQEG